MSDSIATFGKLSFTEKASKSTLALVGTIIFKVPCHFKITYCEHSNPDLEDVF